MVAQLLTDGATLENYWDKLDVQQLAGLSVKLLPFTVSKYAVSQHGGVKPKPPIVCPAIGTIF